MTLFLAASLAFAAGFDHSHAQLDTFLEGAVTPAGVDYGMLAGRVGTLDAYLKEVATADPSSFSNSEKLAFYVNAYNGYTLKMMLEAGPPSSIRDLEGGEVWDKRSFPVAGKQMTLNQMEHDNARKLADGRVHAVVNCASKGCPPLPPDPLTAADLEKQLDKAAWVWAETNAFVLAGDTIKLSKIFDWYSADFEGVAAERDLDNVDGKAEQALWFLAKHVDAATKDKLLSGSLTASWNDYDWSINKK